MLMLFYLLHCAWAVYVTVDFLQTVCDENDEERERGDWREGISIHKALSIEIELLIAHDFELHTAHAMHTSDTNNNPTWISIESSNKLIFVTNTSFLVHVCFKTVALFTGTFFDAVCMQLRESKSREYRSVSNWMWSWTSKTCSNPAGLLSFHNDFFHLSLFSPFFLFRFSFRFNLF